MMKRNFTFLFLLFYCFGLSAQQRYIDEVFTDVNITSDIVYGQNHDYYGEFKELTADVYTPDGDNMEERPLIIMMHAGSYLPAGSILPFGSKNDPHVEEMCMQFAKRGWTVAAINYRVGWNPVSPSAEVRAGTIMEAVYRATLDLKTAVRYFRKTVAEDDNPYGIDPNKVVGAGTNSGGYCVITAATLNRVEEINLLKFLDADFNSFINTDSLGYFDGSGGVEGVNNYQWDGYSGEIDMALNMGGAIGDLSWIEVGEAPIVSFHGVIEELTPYDTDIVIVSLTGQPVVEVSGSRDITTRINELGNNDKFIGLDDAYTQAAEANFSVEAGNGEGCFLFRNKGFEPWGYYNCDLNGASDDGDPNTEFCSSSLQNEVVNDMVETYITNENFAAPYIDTIMNYFAPRAVIQLELEGFEDIISSNSQIEEASIAFDIFPNPANAMVNIESTSNELIKEINVNNINGQLMKTVSDIDVMNYKLDVSDLSGGIYFLEIRTENNAFAQKLIVE